jgi:glycosyltransferase involved in cell wall biosynthesis
MSNGMIAHAASVCVVMPTFEQSAFITRALESLLQQRHHNWTLVIVDDGSQDDTPQIVQPYLAHSRVRYHRFNENRGLGAALNYALDSTSSSYIAYLPSDDVIYADHLSSLVGTLAANPDAVLAYAGVRHHYSRFAMQTVEGEPLQLVQVVHRRTADRWLERDELVTDDLERMYWSKLRANGPFVASDRITCEWVDHPHQRHKVIREPAGGINPYRLRYRVQKPIRFHSTMGNFIDEREQYASLRPASVGSSNGLRILLVGELAYNADRIVALEERGHRLFGLWMPDPYWYNTVGPLPFGNVEDLDRTRFPEEIARIRPDIIYALLNWQAVPFAFDVMRRNPGVPFVWHFKEGPFICLERGTWPQLTALYSQAHGRIYSSPEMAAWFDTLGLPTHTPRLILDGDLPKRDWFDRPRARRLSLDDGDFHTVVPGRPIGLHPENVATLAAQRIHLHFYGDFTHGQWKSWIERTEGLAPGFLHLHDTSIRATGSPNSRATTPVGCTSSRARTAASCSARTGTISTILRGYQRWRPLDCR